MNCQLCWGVNANHEQVNCPWRLCFLKLNHEQYYRLVGYPQTFLEHNHQLPVDGVTAKELEKVEDNPQQGAAEQTKFLKKIGIPTTEEDGHIIKDEIGQNIQMG